jgi:uncharacterized protein
MSFNTMMNRNNFSRDQIQQFFIDLTGDINVTIGEGSFVDAYDEGGLSLSLKQEEHAANRKITFSEIRQGKAQNFQNVTGRVKNFIDTIKMGKLAATLGQKCGMDKSENVAVDLRGNVLTCQNVSAVSVAPNGSAHKIGHTSDLKNTKLNTSTHWSHREECPNCPVLQICAGSCMFLEGPLWEASCDNAFSDAIPTFAAGIEFLTGLIPVRIDGPQREDRRELWESAPIKTKRVIPISQVV